MYFEFILQYANIHAKLSSSFLLLPGRMRGRILKQVIFIVSTFAFASHITVFQYLALETIKGISVYVYHMIKKFVTKLKIVSNDMDCTTKFKIVREYDFDIVKCVACLQYATCQIQMGCCFQSITHPLMWKEDTLFFLHTRKTSSTL